MTVRHIQLRALLLPLCVAIASMAGLAWYGFVYIPSQQRYLNERNFRLLRTLSAQIKAKVDNFDGALDHALKSADQDASGLDKQVGLFAPDLEVLAVTKTQGAKRDSKVEQSLLKKADDPPRVQVQRDEGRNYLYLSLKQKPDHQQQTMIVLAKADLEAATAQYLTPRSEFDALLLVGQDGRVIAQSSPLGLTLARVDRLASAAEPAKAANPNPPDDKNGEPSNVFESLWMTSNTKNVTIGDADYKLYVQSVPLSLIDVETDKPAEWAVCGLVRADKFRAESTAISYSDLLLFTGALAGIFFMIPLLKLHVLSPHERLGKSDGVWVAASAFLVTGLLTFGLLDVYYFRYDFRKTTDDQLRRIAVALRCRFLREARDIASQMDAFDQSPKISDHQRSYSAHVTPQISFSEKGELKCGPQEACKDYVVTTEDYKTTDNETTYPYFNLVTWIDDGGQQRIKWSATKRVTPFLNLKEEKVEYYPEVERAWHFPDTSRRGGIAVTPSPNTGVPTTLFWRTRHAVKPDGSTTPLVTQAMTLVQPPISLDQPVLPPGVQFAVISNDGRVMFHSDSTRSLKENFLQESEDDVALKATLAARRDQALSVNYLGRPRRLYLIPLLMPTAEDWPFADPDWSLAVFQDTIVPQTLNLETLTLAVALFAMFGAVLAGAWCLHRVLASRGATKWFWPDARKGARYRLVAWTNGLLGALSLVAIRFLTSVSLLVAVALLVTAALVATYILVARVDWPEAEGEAWKRSFLWARLSLLFVVSAIPAIACFRVAYDFEAGVFVRSGQVYLAKAIEARQDHIRKERVEPLFKGAANSARLDRIVSQGKPYELDLLPFFDADREPLATRVEFAKGRLDDLLAALHRLYGDVAIDPASVFPLEGDSDATPQWKWWVRGPHRFSLTRASVEGDALTATAKTADLDKWSFPIVLVLVGALYVLLRFGVWPLYAIELYPSTDVGDATVSEPAGNLLLVGPTGSGKSARLRKDPTNLVFDVQTLAYVDRRRYLRPVPVERRKVSGAPEPFSGIPWTHESEPVEFPRRSKTTSETWTEPFNAYTLPGDPNACVCIDHFDHRLEEPAFRDRMLTFLEDLIYRHERRVCVACDREPLEQLREARATRPATETSPEKASGGAAIDLGRWARVFQSFHVETVAVAPPPNPFGPAADPYYRSVWSSCSSDEKLALRQLADEGVVNPRNHVVVEQLLGKGLVRRDPTFRIMNEAFRHFIVRETPAEQVDAWEQRGVKMPWGTIRTTLATVILGLLGLLALTQQQLLNAWVGYVPTLAPVVPTALKLLAGVRRDPKTAILNA